MNCSFERDKITIIKVNNKIIEKKY